MSGVIFHFRMQRSPKSLSTLAVVVSEQLVRVIGMVKRSDQNRSSYKELIRYFVSWNLQGSCESASSYEKDGIASILAVNTTPLPLQSAVTASSKLGVSLSLLAYMLIAKD